MKRPETFIVEDVELKKVQFDCTRYNGALKGYQRAADNHLTKLVEKHGFDERAVNTLCVAVRDDGTLWGVDCQHRVGLLLSLGYTHWPAVTFQTSGEAEERSVFLKANAHKNVTSLHKLQMRMLDPEDELGQYVKRTLDQLALRVPRDIKHTGCLVLGYRTQVLGKALQCACAIESDRGARPLSGVLVHALVHLFSEYEKADGLPPAVSVLVKKVQPGSATVLINRAKGRYSAGSSASLYAYLAMEIADLYNKRLSKTSRIARRERDARAGD